MVHLSDAWYIHVLMSHYLLDEWLSCGYEIPDLCKNRRVGPAGSVTVPNL